jgi:hypothetical protein
MKKLFVSKKQSALLAGLTGIVLSLFIGTVAPAYAAATCDMTGAVGSATKTFTVPAGKEGSYEVWLELKGVTAPTVAVELVGDTCVKKTLPALSTTNWGWVSVGTNFSLTAKTYTFKFTAYTTQLQHRLRLQHQLRLQLRHQHQLRLQHQHLRLPAAQVLT